MKGHEVDSVSVEALMAKKNPAMSRRIPRPMYFFLERIAHTEEIRAYTDRANGLSPVQALALALRELKLSYRCTGWEIEIPEDERITLAANHPHGGVDALVLLDLVTRRFCHALVPANDIVRVISPLAAFFVPVDKHGSNKEQYRMIDDLFAGTPPVVVFPAGRTGRPKSGVVTDFPWTKTFVKKSRMHGRTILPVYIQGKNSLLFYVVAGVRKKLRIKANLEMFLLVHELVRKRGACLKLVVGPPIHAALLDKRADDRQWAEYLRSYVQALGEGTEDAFFPWLEKRERNGELQGETNGLD